MLKEELYSLEKLTEDKQLIIIRQIAEGKRTSFEKLVRFYEPKIRAFAKVYAQKVGESCDDLSQDIFIQIYLSAKKFKGKSLVSTWIFSIAKYTISNKLRKRG